MGEGVLMPATFITNNFPPSGQTGDQFSYKNGAPGQLLRASSWYGGVACAGSLRLGVQEAFQIVAVLGCTVTCRENTQPVVPEMPAVPFFTILNGGTPFPAPLELY